MTVNPTAHMTVNGNPYPFQENQTLLELLEVLQLDPLRVAVMIGEDVYPAGQLPPRRLQAGDQIEIVKAMQGG